jgi:hypothetical protein
MLTRFQSWKPEGKKNFKIYTTKKEDNIKIDVKEIGVPVRIIFVWNRCGHLLSCFEEFDEMWSP